MISKKEVQHIAKLARLGLTQKEVEKMQKELSLILDYFNLLKGVKTEKVEPTSHSILAKSYYAKDLMRKDKIVKQPPEKINKLIEMASEKKQRYIRVKAIL
ncbi:Asp-tRNA(Asn)/Glu-tRNA(Gln) amidotransferase subunit GatC [Patescibacteria group bacterium]|nr:Asp-tRNA(Asn)/Glu-tRNA(Gln) amidotransferase subunit GatC [Patescibacteria group bacterium]